MPLLTPAGSPASSLGLGTRGHRGARKDTDPGDAERAIAAAIEAGCTLIECGPQWGESERLVGAAVRALRARDRVLVATRVDTDGALPTVGAVRAAIEASLRACKLEALPLVWLDGWRDAWLDLPPWPELASSLADRVRDGDVLAWGLGVDDLAAAERVTTVDVAAIGVRWSLFDRRAERALIPAAVAAGRAVVARSPLADGALGGELAPGVRFRPEDERRAWSPQRLAALPPALAGLTAFTRNAPPAARASDDGRAILDGLRRHPELVHATVAELAIAACVATAGISSTIIGVRTPAHAATWWPIGPAPLPAAVATALASRPWGEGWYGVAADA